MWKYIIKRIITTFFILLAITFIVFSLVYLTPGEPSYLILPIDATLEAHEHFNETHGLNRPFIVRYADYVFGIVTRFDFGLSFRTSTPVIEELIRIFPVTFRLALFGVITTLLLGIPLGVLAAVKHTTAVDRGINTWAIFIGTVPGFFLAIVLMMIFAVRLGWFPVFGIGSWRHYILPVASMAIPASAAFIRLSRAVMLDTVHMEYVKTARAKGSFEWIVIWKHAFRNAMLPVINGAGVFFAVLLGGTIITEQIFAMHGIGMYALQALRLNDYPAIMASTILLSFIFCIIILAIDVIYAFLDPRIKAKFSS